MLMRVFAIAAMAAAVACSVVKSRATDTLKDDGIFTSPQPVEEARTTQTAVFAGGCFWGVDAVFKHVKGVVDVKSGYSGGETKNPRYEDVGQGDTGHAESVKVVFDPTKVTYIQLLGVFFSVAHDPTEVNRQGPDIGTQYRSVVFYTNDEQKKAAEAYIDAINKSKSLPKPVATQVVPLKTFYLAEDYHQNYLATHRDQPYIVYNDLPKLAALKEKFPDLYVEK